MNGTAKVKSKVTEMLTDEKHKNYLDMLDLLDPSKNYEVEYTRNRAKFAQVLKGLKTSTNVLYTTNILLHGDIEYYPTLIVNSDLAIMLVISTISYLDKCSETHKLLIYEKDPRLSFGF